MNQTTRHQIERDLEKGGITMACPPKSATLFFAALGVESAKEILAELRDEVPCPICEEPMLVGELSAEARREFPAIELRCMNCVAIGGSDLYENVETPRLLDADEPEGE